MLIALASAILLTTSAFSQTLIAVQNGGTPRFYSILQDALNGAQNKDTIYIPGGSFSLTNNKITIDKELHLIGAGHYQDSTVVGISQLNASIVLVTGANNSSFEGFYLNGEFNCGTSTANEDVDNITISRCNCTNITLSRFSTNWTVRESIARSSLTGYYWGGTTSPYAQNNFFSNNIVCGDCKSFGPNNDFKNNIFLNVWNGFYCRVTNIESSIFRNNIFSYSSLSITSCTTENNIFYYNPTIQLSNNIYNQTSSTTFVNQSETTFDYKQDYHLKSDSPGKNAGKDGTDIGIYGGAFPWKEGSVPSNPHFKSVKISPKTDNSGNLNVRINVAAQDN